jgi:trypsin
MSSSRRPTARALSTAESLSDKSNTQGGAEYIDVAQKVQHPSYNSNSEAYDFMLVKLDNSVTNPNLTPIAVNSVGSNPANNDILTVIGFGATSEGGNQANKLKKVNVNYIDSATCNNLYDGDIIDSVMLCAGVDGGGKDSCQGDSGGPIFDQDRVQVGVVSWGYGCAQENYPGVYSRVSGAKDWIDATICELSSTPPASCGQTGGGNTDTGGDNTGDN